MKSTAKLALKTHHAGAILADFGGSSRTFVNRHNSRNLPGKAE
jgi:hypothetical protein